jgi:hypothetical protein
MISRKQASVNTGVLIDILFRFVHHAIEKSYLPPDQYQAEKTVNSAIYNDHFETPKRFGKDTSGNAEGRSFPSRIPK